MWNLNSINSKDNFNINNYNPLTTLLQKDYDNDNAISSIDNLLRIIKEKEDVSNGKAKLLAVRDIVLNDSVITIEGV